MSDLFHEDVSSEYIGRVIDTMKRADWHVFQVLTKRAARMRELLLSTFPEALALRNVWWGVSVEDRKHGVPRIAELQRMPTARRFLSVEPLLEDLGDLNLEGIPWVIVGGESGWKARPMREEWVTKILQQCEAAGSEFFFKQWGGVFKRRNGRMLDGRTYDGRPSSFSTAPTLVPTA
jgi:protein gp37